MRVPSGVAVMNPSNDAVACVTSNGTSAHSIAAMIPAAIAIARLRITYKSHSASGATRNPAKKWVSSASPENTPHSAMFRVEGSRHARAKYSSDAPLRAVSSMYSRASCEYQIRNGLTAASAAATRPARRETSSRPHM